MKFQPLFDFLNIFSQQFIPEKVGKEAEEKPWLYQEFPEMTGKSHKDVCTQGEKIICFLLFVNGDINESQLSLLKGAKKEVSGFKSGFIYKFAWINAKKHQDWNAKLEIEGNQFPQLRVLRTGPRIKFVKHEADTLTPRDFVSIMEKITGGDARSSMLRQGVPEFSSEL